MPHDPKTIKAEAITPEFLRGSTPQTLSVLLGVTPEVSTGLAKAFSSVSISQEQARAELAAAKAALDSARAEAASERASLTARISAITADRDQALASIEKLTSERDAALASVARLEEDLPVQVARQVAQLGISPRAARHAPSAQGQTLDDIRAQLAVCRDPAERSRLAEELRRNRKSLFED